MRNSEVRQNTEFRGYEPATDQADKSITKRPKVLSDKASGNKGHREHVANTGLPEVKSEITVIKKKKKRNIPELPESGLKCLLCNFFKKCTYS